MYWCYCLLPCCATKAGNRFLSNFFLESVTTPPAQLIPKVESNDTKFETQPSADTSMNSSSHGFPFKKDKDNPGLDTSTQLESSILQLSAKEQTFSLLFSRLEGYEVGSDNER